VERDPLGELEVPRNAYYGIQTYRAMSNFTVSGRRPRPELIASYAQVKKACALANMYLGLLDKKRGEAIVRAAEEVAKGSLLDQFPVDIFQAGGGTSTNMNLNEVLANRALEILGKERGEYEHLHPNDHVNMSQSSNDTYPTASHIAVMGGAMQLDGVLRSLAVAFAAKGGEFQDTVKSGRTHLMDALPVTLGDELNAYSSALRRAAQRLQQRRDDLLEIPIGGTATGTGVNASPLFRELVIRNLSDQCRLPLKPAQNGLEAIQSWALLAALSGSLKELAIELIRIANDLRLMNSGPVDGLNEIILPAVQPGSSIMVGKVNPVMAECLNMISFQVIGNDLTVSLAVQAGQLELNAMGPVVVFNVLDSIAYLNNFLPLFEERCVKGIEARDANGRPRLNRNPILATLLAPRIGYLRAAEIAHQAAASGKSVAQVAVERGILSEKEAEDVLDPKKLARIERSAGTADTGREGTMGRRKGKSPPPKISHTGE